MRLAALALSVASVPLPAAGQTPDISLTRLDCGHLRVNDAASFSDTHGYDGKRIEMPVSCYLIRHGDDLLLWDAGLSASLLGAALSDTAPIGATVRRTLVEQLAELGISPDRIGRVAVSHYHLDHAGQASSFPRAVLLIGAKDWTAVTSASPPPLIDQPGLAPWTSGKATVQQVAGDLDIFGDGSVVMFATPGHTVGHTSLLVRLPDMGPVLLTGDLYHTRRNFEVGDVSAGNVSRADTLASMDRFVRTAETLHATVIIGHEPADIAKLPDFPKAAH